MINERPENKAVGIASLVAGALGLALLFGATGTACDDEGGGGGTGGVTTDAAAGSGGANNNAGAGGTAGSGGTAGAPDGGTGGTGGTDPMADCSKNDRIPVTADITTSTVWKCNTYVLKKKIHITNGAILTVEKGSKIFGDGDAQNPAALISTRDGKLIAKGSPKQPIVFTSIVAEGSRAPGDSFAGVVLLGKAGINNGSCVNDAVAGGACDAPGFFETVIEGIEATDLKGKYGGSDDTHDCGELSYIRVEFAGFVIGAGNELNGITLGACGNKTKVSHVQVHRGFDDGIEIFGGTVNVDHALISGSTDDGLDFDNGWRGKAQFVIIHQAYGAGDKGIEADNLGGNEIAEPRTNPELWNFTMIGESNGRIALHLREGMRGKLRNFLVQGFGAALDEDAAMVVPATEWPTFLNIENSLFFMTALAKDETAANNDMGFDEAAALMDVARKNSTTVNPMLGSTAIAAPNYVPAGAVTGQAVPGAGLDATATYFGAVAPGTAAPWYMGWTAFPQN